MARTMLTDEQWQKLLAILQEINIYDNHNLRNSIEGMLYRTRVGCPWRDVPKEFGEWSSIYNRFRYWRITNKWQEIFNSICW